MHSVLILDASVIIDLSNGGLLAKTLTIPARFLCPDVILARLHTPPSEMLRRMGVGVFSFEPEQVEEVIGLRAKHRALSANDLFALIAARDEPGVLVTGDLKLRRTAEAKGVPVHGTLWLLDEMIRLGIITPRQAAGALDAMRAKGSRLPRQECEHRLSKWKSIGAE